MRKITTQRHSESFTENFEHEMGIFFSIDYNRISYLYFEKLSLNWKCIAYFRHEIYHYFEIYISKLQGVKESTKKLFIPGSGLSIIFDMIRRLVIFCSWHVNAKTLLTMYTYSCSRAFVPCSIPDKIINHDRSFLFHETYVSWKCTWEWK